MSDQYPQCGVRLGRDRLPKQLGVPLVPRALGSRRGTSSPVPWIWLLGAVLLPSSAFATTADQLCTGDPCIIVGDLPVDDGSVLDFGSATVQLQGTLDLTQPASVGGSATILAGALVIESGGQIDAQGGGTVGGGTITVTTTGDISILADSAFHVGGNPAGAVVLDAGGSITTTGQLNLAGLGNGTTGGTLIVSADGDITWSGDLGATSTPSGLGGSISLVAGGNATFTGPVDVSGGAAGGGSFAVEACEVTMTGGVSILGLGGSIDILGVDALTLSGLYTVNTASDLLVRWGAIAAPPNLSGATFLPGSVQSLDPNASCATIGGDDDDDDSGDDDDDSGDDDDANGDDDDANGDDDDSGDDDDANGDDDDANGDDDDSGDDDDANDDDDDSGDDDDDSASIGDDDGTTDIPIFVGGGEGCNCESSVGSAPGTPLALLMLLLGLSARRRPYPSAWRSIRG